MSATGTTELSDLPSLPVESEPVQLRTTELNTKVDNPAAKLAVEREKEAQEMNALVTGIQTASAAGALQLPQRDVPQNQEHLVRDNEVRANYVPSQPADYIGQGPTTEEIVMQHAAKQRARQDSDDMLDVLHVPIILSILYFAFQMPILRKFAFDKLPFLFSKDGNTSTLGSAIMSVAFAASYVAVQYALDYLSV